MSNKTQNLVTALQNGASLTTTDIRRLGVSNPTDAIFRLRKQGYCIYANKSGTETSYRIGRPSRAMVAQLYQIFGGAMYDRDFFAE